MFFSKILRKYLRRLTRQVTWPTMFFLALAQAGITYLLFVAAGETELTQNPLQFIYYNMVVVSFPVIQFTYDKLSKINSNL